MQIKNQRNKGISLLEIIKHTPVWVFGLLAVLVIFGILQSRDREVKVAAVLILPIAMTILSILGVSSAFGLALIPISVWLVGVLLCWGVGIKLAKPSGVSYCSEAKKLSIAGSWLPLILMMAIFFTKYFVGVVVARQLPILEQAEFMLIISLSYGCFSGVLIARAAVMLRARHS